MASFYVQNFGCRATQADGAALERQFQECGLERAGAPEHAEFVVLNTCTVTASADQDARAAIRRIHRENPDCRIIVTGCYAQRAPQEIASLPGVTQVVGNSHKHRLAELAIAGAEDQAGFVPLSALRIGHRPTTNDRLFVSDIFAHTELLAAPVFDAANERTRPNLKVQDGCDNRCSFCVIPYVRGHSRSLPLAEVIREVNALVQAGYREVVISGINLGRWGRDLVVGRSSLVVSEDASGEELTSAHGKGVLPTTNNHRPTTNGQRLTTNDQRLTTLIRAILEYTALEKLRISSVEPMDWTKPFIRLMAESPRIAKHAHVPMQSGSDRILRAMHRKYRPWHYREKILQIRDAMPTAAIGADVMVGFPGESDADFEQTRRMVEELPFTYLHVFTYSPRPGTPAAALPDQVPVRVARERNRILRELAAEKKRAFMHSLLGTTITAITLNSPDDRYTEALTDNYLKLHLKGCHAPNRWLNARVEKVESAVLIGSPELPMHRR